jgi:hypothetical protein
MLETLTKTFWNIMKVLMQQWQKFWTRFCPRKKIHYIAQQISSYYVLFECLVNRFKSENMEVSC